jgi:hypothetical protein
MKNTKNIYRTMKRHWLIVLRFTILFNALAVTVTNAQSQIIYVRKGAPAAGNGTSWSQAYPDLQPALAAAPGISGSKQIWVARGEYRATSGVDRTVSFNIPSQTMVYGGFAGTEASLEDRNWKANRTVLSGDLGILFDKSDNSYHVVVMQNVGSDTGIDGFIIKEGNANGVSAPDDMGGGILILSTNALAKPEISNCEIINNSAGKGGGLANVSNGHSTASETVNCFFNGNSAESGGAAANINLNGGGASAPSFVNCSFSSNHASGSGGGIANIGSRSIIVNSTFTGNSCLVHGGAIFNTAVPDTTIVKNCILWKNFKGSVESPEYNQIANPLNDLLAVKNNIIQGGYGTTPDQNLDKDPLFEKEPSVVGKYPRTSMIPVEWSDPKYENQLNFTGFKMPRKWTYFTLKDHDYNKLYISGEKLQVIDFSNLTNDLPTSTIHTQFSWGRLQRSEKAIHEAGNKIYFGSLFDRPCFN